MDLRRISKHFDSSEFLYLDPLTRQWVDGFEGRLAVTDRFLSNFNRPTRKRMLYTDFDTDLSQFDVIRHKVTQDIYLIGVERRDTFKGAKTTQLLICHMVTPNSTSAGLATVHRPTVSGSGDDLGWVELLPAGERYIDLELRATSREPGSKDTEIGMYYAWTETHADLKDGDTLLLNGEKYVIEEVAYDAELKHLRVISRDQYYENMVWTIGTPSRTFDQVAKRFVDVPATRNVSGYVVGYHDSNDGYDKDASDYVDIRIRTAHIGFDPKPNMQVEWKGRKYVVSYVKQHEHRKQWDVRLK